MALFWPLRVKAQRDSLGRRAWHRGASSDFGAKGHYPAFGQPSQEDRLIAAAIAAVVANRFPKQTSTHENVLHGVSGAKHRLYPTGANSSMQ